MDWQCHTDVYPRYVSHNHNHNNDDDNDDCCPNDNDNVHNFDNDLVYDHNCAIHNVDVFCRARHLHTADIEHDNHDSSGRIRYRRCCNNDNYDISRCDNNDSCPDHNDNRSRTVCTSGRHG